MLDSIDREIIRLLQRDARQSSGDLARQLDLGASTVRRRLRTLIKKGVVHIVGAVNAIKVGYPVAAIIAFQVEHRKLSSVAQMLINRREFSWVSVVSGRFDIMALAHFRSNEDLFSFLQGPIADIDGIEDTETFLCLHLKSAKYFLFVHDPDAKETRETDQEMSGKRPPRGRSKLP